MMCSARSPDALQGLRWEEFVSVGYICHWFQNIGFIFKSYKSPVGKEDKNTTFKDSFLFRAETQLLTRENERRNSNLFICSALIGKDISVTEVCIDSLCKSLEKGV